MMTENWTPTGVNWMRVGWVADTQVIYVLFARPEGWQVVRKVSGSAHPTGEYLVTVLGDLTMAQRFADEDLEELQAKGL